jgi:hypothetical protein
MTFRFKNRAKEVTLDEVERLGDARRSFHYSAATVGAASVQGSFKAAFMTWTSSTSRGTVVRSAAALGFGRAEIVAAIQAM